MGEGCKKLKEIVTKILLYNEGEYDETISRENTETWDSLAHLMLINEIESVFNISFDDDDLLEIDSIKDLKNKLRNLGVKV